MAYPNLNAPKVCDWLHGNASLGQSSANTESLFRSPFWNGRRVLIESRYHGVFEAY